MNFFNTFFGAKGDFFNFSLKIISIYDLKNFILIASSI